MRWIFKLVICIAVDLADFLLGGFLFLLPVFPGVIIATAISCALFGARGLFYLVEAIDVTGQIDIFIPTATIIAIANKDR